MNFLAIKRVDEKHLGTVAAYKKRLFVWAEGERSDVRAWGEERREVEAAELTGRFLVDGVVVASKEMNFPVS